MIAKEHTAETVEEKLAGSRSQARKKQADTDLEFTIEAMAFMRPAWDPTFPKAGPPQVRKKAEDKIANSAAKQEEFRKWLEAVGRFPIGRPTS